MKRTILGAVAALLLAGPLSAHAAMITISGQGALDGSWDVTTTTGTVSDVLASLQTQAWYGNTSAAQAFASALGLSLGTTSFLSYTGGPVFATAAAGGSGALLRGVYVNTSGSLSNLALTGSGLNFVSVRFAVATKVASVPEPGTLALLGLGLLGVAARRRLRAS